MPKVAYSEKERKQIKEELIEVGLDLMVRQGAQQTTVEQIYKKVGISRTFFYSFFPAKEDLIIQAIYYQQPKLIAHVKELMKEDTANWQTKFKYLLSECCDQTIARFAIMSVEEQQTIFKSLSKERHEEFKKKQLKMFRELMLLFGIETDEGHLKILFNLVLSLIILQRSFPNTLPFLFEEEAKSMADIQCESIIEYMEKLKCSK